MIDALRELAATPGWVAEEADLHLLPHLEAALPTEGWQIEASIVEPDGRLVITLRPTHGGAVDRRAVRSAAYALIGSIAETVTAIHEVVGDGGHTFEVTTGTLPSVTGFATHGHVVVLRFPADPES